jgi:hypothetical protein
MLAYEKNKSPTSTPSFGSLLGIDADSFNARRKKLVKDLRKRNKEACKSKSYLAPKQRLKFSKSAKHRKKVGYGKMTSNIRIDSMETDSFGARLIMKTRMNMAPFVVPIVGDVKKAKKDPKIDLKRKKVNKKKAKLIAMNAEEPQPMDPTLQDGVFIGIDEGRAKLFTAAFRTKNQGDFQRRTAMEKDLKVHKNRPRNENFETITLTRNKYNAYTKLRIREKWELRRVAANEGLSSVFLFGFILHQTLIPSHLFFKSWRYIAKKKFTSFNFVF